MYESDAKIRRKVNAITPDSFEILYLKFETSNLKPVFTVCEICKLTSYEFLRKKKLLRTLWLDWFGSGQAVSSRISIKR